MTVIGKLIDSSQNSNKIEASTPRSNSQAADQNKAVSAMLSDKARFFDISITILDKQAMQAAEGCTSLLEKMGQGELAAATSAVGKSLSVRADTCAALASNIEKLRDERQLIWASNVQPPSPNKDLATQVVEAREASQSYLRNVLKNIK